METKANTESATEFRDVDASDKRADFLHNGDGDFPMPNSTPTDAVEPPLEPNSSPEHSDDARASPDTDDLEHFPLSVDGSRVRPTAVKTQTDFAVAAARSAWIFVSTLYAIAAYLLWFGVVLLPLRFAAPALYWRMEAQIFRFLQSPVAHWMMTAGYTGSESTRVEEVGDDISSLENDEVLLLPNHQSTGDVPTIMMGKEKREKQLVSLSRHVDDIYSRHYRKWMILFPEGGFFRKRKAKSQSYAKKSNFPVLQYVALPRVGALHTITDLMHPLLPERPEVLPNGMKYRCLKWIVDMTIGYPGQKPLDFFNVTFANRPPCKTTIHYRIYKASEVPLDHVELRDWLFARYVEKDYLLSEFYRTGRFPSSCRPPSDEADTSTEELVDLVPRPVEIDSDWLTAIHAFFLSSLAVQLYLFYRFYYLVF